MSKFLLSILGILVLVTSTGYNFSNPNFYVNQKGKLREVSYLKSWGIVKANFRTVNIELRIWKDNYATGQTKMIQLIQSKNEEWFAQSLDYFCYSSNHCNLENPIIDTLELNNLWNKNWMQIQSEELLQLVSQKDLNKELRNRDSQIIIADGEGYTFEEITRKGIRKYVYENPLSYHKHYSKIEKSESGYEKVVKLISILENSFEFNFQAEEKT